jgi:SAM-dependent methyltransferase
MLLFESFVTAVNAMDRPRILELGAARTEPDKSTSRRPYFPKAGVFHGTDIQMTEDVDFLADVHKLSETAGHGSYDAVLTCSGFEHFKYPHLAAFEISKVLKPNGYVFVQTHSMFPLHAYPYDYFRFSTEALEGVFGTRNGVNVIQTAYEFQCTLSSDRFDCDWPGWLNVGLFGQKTHKTPKEYALD